VAEPKKVKAEPSEFLRDAMLRRLDDEQTATLYPTIYDLMTPRYEGQKITRLPASMSVRIDSANILVTISCPTEGLQTTIVVNSIANFLEETEKILTQGKCHWGLTWDRKKKQGQNVESAIE